MRKACIIAIACLFLLMAPVAAAHEGENLLYNGDFLIYAEDHALPAGWYYEAWIPENSEVSMQTEVDGQHAVVLNNYFDNDARICQKIAVQPNTSYRFSCEIMVEHEVIGDAGAGISVLDTFSGTQPLFHTQGWEEISFVGKTGKKQTEIVLALRIGGYGALGRGIAQFRNVSVQELDGDQTGAFSLEPQTASGGSRLQDQEGPNWAGIVLGTLLCLVVAAYVYQACLLRPAWQRVPVHHIHIAILMLLACLMRVNLSAVFVGHSTDIGCFMAWADTMAEYGPGRFYHTGMFADYPPGYMYILWAVGALRRALGIAYDSGLFVLLLKLPSILADLGSAYLVYRIAIKQGFPERRALLLLGIVALNPAAAFVSGGWGQIDSLLALALAGVCLLLLNRRLIVAGALYGLAILLKPQALMAGPLLAVVYFLPDGETPYKKRLLQTALAVLSAVAMIFLLALPFDGGQGFGWLYEKYFSTATSYPYASVEAFNLFALIGGNWAGIDTKPFLFSYGVWGICFILVSVVAAACLFCKAYRNNPKGALFLSMGFLLTALFTLGPYMHERYLFPALLLLFLAAVYYNDKRLYACVLYFSITLLFNALCAFYIVDYPQARGAAYDAITVVGSLAMVVGFVFFCISIYDIAVRGNTQPTALLEYAQESVQAQSGHSWPEGADENALLLPQAQYDSKLHFTKKDMLFCWGLTVVYAAFALTNLGSLHAPETEYESVAPGEAVEIQLGGEGTLNEFWVFGGIAQGTLLLETDDETQITFDQTYDDMFRWKRVYFSVPTQSITLSNYAGTLRLREIAFFDTEGRRMTAAIVPNTALNADAAYLVDEPDSVPAKPGYLNGMYFDELYHARTAYEHLNGLEPYENSHPPLGKVFIMLGIAIFGMNAFGWRIVGALFGIAMVPLLYAFGKRLFQKPAYALLTASLFAFDFMHFTQTRIATIDVYGVFFILLMFYYMYQYYCMNFYVDGLEKTLKPLGLAGLFFGLGAASKWICIYAGAGLAVMLGLSLWSRYREYRQGMASGDASIRKLVQPFWRNTLKTLLWCCLFYIAVPLVVYVFAYIPYFFSETPYDLTGVWHLQTYMFDYHSGLDATHPFQSSWWQWPFTIRPMWYYMGENEAADMLSTITASGNPAVWWVCTLGACALVIKRITGKIKHEPGMTMAFVGIIANFLPWVLVTRCTFIYHFFATVPFILFCSIYLLKAYETGNPKLRWVKWAWMGACLLLFLLLYPGLSGLPIPLSYARMLQYLPGGGLLYGA